MSSENELNTVLRARVLHRLLYLRCHIWKHLAVVVWRNLSDTDCGLTWVRCWGRGGNGEEGLLCTGPQEAAVCTDLYSG